MNSVPLIMINSPANLFLLTTPLTAMNHQVAEEFYQQHSNPQKATQIYLNTLSVQSVNFYLTCLGIQTSLERSQSWNPALQVLIDTADLWVDGLGSLECRPMLADANVCVVPAQALAERIGYVVVRLNQELTEATLLGFVPSVETDNLHLETLQAIDELPGYLNQLLNQLAPVESQSAATRLSDWFYTVTETGWKTLEMLIGEWQEQPALSFRTPANLPAIESSETGAKRGKLVALGDALEDHVLLLMEVTPTQTVAEYQINLELCPVGKEVYLPRSLHLSLLDEAGKTVLQPESSDSEGLEFQFSGESGEHFSVKISYQGRNVVETFEI
jgi:Protein of unknown function (DUF1822)